MKYVPSPRCNFCQEEETIKHMLWECQETKNLLKDFKRWLLNNNVNLIFVEELFIFNIGNTYSSADLHIFIIVKYYIYATKRLDHPLSVANRNKSHLLFSSAEMIKKPLWQTVWTQISFSRLLLDLICQ